MIENLLARMAGSTPLVVASLLAAAAMLVFVLGAASVYVSWRNPARRRLAGIGGTTSANGEDPGARILEGLGPLGRIFSAGGDGKEKGRISRLLHLAGYRSPTAPTTFFSIKAVLAVLLPAGWLMAAGYFPKLPASYMWFIAGFALFMGMVAPNSWLERKVAARQRALRNGFPDALDLLVICVESGLGLAASIERVSDELRFSHPELAQELALVNVEIRAGVDRETALKNLSERTGLQDIRGLVSLLNQTLRFGTSVADTLRVYSEEFRDQRTQSAEEAAAKIGTKLIFPLILCEFPAFFVITIGPVIVRISEVYGK